MSNDIISLSVSEVIDECTALGCLYVYRELDCKETETEVLVNFDYEPEEPAELGYPGCPARVVINEILHPETRSAYNSEVIDRLLDCEDEILALYGEFAYEKACDRAEYERDCEKDRLIDANL
jgi:hypothetical protein